jgi:hypothetical protein
MREVMDESFIMAPSDWTLEKLVAFIRKARFSHLVVLREEGPERYLYLRSRREVRDVITAAAPNVTLHQAFNLHEYTATPEVEASADSAGMSHDQAIIVEEGRVVGFIDDREPPAASGAFAEIRAYPMDEGPGVIVDKPFRAYPELSVPDQVPASGPFDIFAGFRDTPDPKLGGGDPIQVDKPEPDKDCLLLLSGDGVTIDPDHAYVPLRSNAVARFTGTLASGAMRASVKALFVYDNQLIGSARRELEVQGASDGTSPVSGAVSSPCRMKLPGPETAVDITVSVNHKRDGTLEWTLVAPAYPKRIAIQKLETTLPDARQFAGDLMRDLKTQKFSGPLARVVLETAGQEVASLMPSEFFDVLGTVYKKIGRTPTLLLLTNETYVPWELAYISEPLEPGAPPFLAAQTVMGRWLEDSDVMLPPSASLEVKRITAVASEYGLNSGQAKLLEALAEQRMMCEQWGAIALEAKSSDMTAMITGMRITGHLVHFAVHGYSDPAANNQTLLLADKTQLPAAAMTGAYKCGETPRFSFVFLNACQVGTPGRSLGHAGGFPGVLVRGGTLGFIAPLWDVDDAIAREGAEAFYRETFTTGASVGATLHARRRQYDNGSTTPIAYIYYGHPGLRLSRPT